jgi:hypothetical protein
MKNLFKIIIGVFIASVLTSCATLDNDEFVYIGHPPQYPSYQLYYDKSKSLFLLIDKRNGCFEHNESGTCMAFSKEETEDFREDILLKMMAIDKKLAEDGYGKEAIPELEKAGISTIKKPIPTKEVQAIAIKQIMVNRSKEYHLVRGQQDVGADMIATIVPVGASKEIKIIFTINFPAIVDPKKGGTPLQPFVVDPGYLYYHMTMDAVTVAEDAQKGAVVDHKATHKKVNDYLKDIVDNSTENTDNGQAQ